MQGKNEQSAEHTVAVGLDVSKNWLDVALWPINTSFRVANNKKGHKALIRRLAGFDVSCVVNLCLGKERTTGIRRQSGFHCRRNDTTVVFQNPGEYLVEHKRHFFNAIAQRECLTAVDVSATRRDDRWKWPKSIIRIEAAF